MSSCLLFSTHQSPDIPLLMRFMFLKCWQVIPEVLEFFLFALFVFSLESRYEVHDWIHLYADWINMFWTSGTYCELT
jgi:hypothetical protein